MGRVVLHRVGATVARPGPGGVEVVTVVVVVVLLEVLVVVFVLLLLLPPTLTKCTCCVQISASCPPPCLPDHPPSL